MEDMPRPRPPFLQRQLSRHGKTCWYIRRGRGKRVRLKSPYGTEAFWTEYRAGLEGVPAPTGKPASRVGTVSWLWERYRETAAWKGLSVATRRQRENIMLHVLKSVGETPCIGILRKDIVASRDARSDTPSQARNFLDAMRGLFRWALDAGHIKIDPTARVANPSRPDTGGFPAWTEADIDRYQARWPLGTKERVWLDLLLYTGLRRGDAVKLGRQHVRDGVAAIKTGKTGIQVTIPILPILAATLAAGPCGDLAFICGASRKPLTKESFGNAFRIACRAAGLRKSAHGLRKAGAIRAANNGATESEMKAIFGWTNSAMPSLYTKDADRARIAKQAMTKLMGTAAEQALPSPDEKVRASGEKA